MILSAVSPKVLRVMQKTGFLEKLGENNLAEDIFAALEKAEKYIENQAAAADTDKTAEHNSAAT